MLRSLTVTEIEVIETLVQDLDDMIVELTTVLDPDEQAVREIRGVRGWLKGLLDTDRISKKKIL